MLPALAYQVSSRLTSKLAQLRMVAARGLTKGGKAAAFCLYPKGRSKQTANAESSHTKFECRSEAEAHMGGQTLS